MQNEKSFYEQFSIDYVNTKANDTNLQNSKLRRLDTPKYIGIFNNGYNEYSPIYHIGFKNDQRVYRVSNRCADRSRGSTIGVVNIHDPPLFPNVNLLGCGLHQVDVTLREKTSVKI